MPLGFFLSLTRLIVPLTAGGEGKGGHPASVGRAPDFGVCPQIPNQLDFVETPTHSGLQSSGVGPGRQKTIGALSPFVNQRYAISTLSTQAGRKSRFCGRKSARPPGVYRNTPGAGQPLGILIAG